MYLQKKQHQLSAYDLTASIKRIEKKTILRNYYRNGTDLLCHSPDCYKYKIVLSFYHVYFKDYLMH